MYLPKAKKNGRGNHFNCGDYEALVKNEVKGNHGNDWCMITPTT